MHKTGMYDEHFVIVSNSCGDTTAIEVANGKVVGSTTVKLSPEDYDDYDWGTGFDLALNRLIYARTIDRQRLAIEERILPMIEIGDMVEITDPGKRYRTYRSWFTENNVSARLWEPDRAIRRGNKGIVLAKYPHETNDRLLYYVLMLNGGFGCLFNEDGVRRVGA